MLPRELIYDILDQDIITSNTETLCNLRCTSKFFYERTSQILFSKLRIKTVFYRPKKRDNFKDMLTPGKKSMFHHVKTLHLEMFPSHHVDIWLDVLHVLIPCLSNLQAVRWDHVVSDTDYPPHAIENLEKQFGSLPNINEFFLTIREYPDFSDHEFPATKIPAPPFHLQKLTVQWWFSIRPPPPIMSQLSTLIANSPDLESLSFGVTHDFNCEDNFGEQVSFEELFGPASSLPTDLKLKSLEVRAILITPDDFHRHLRHLRHLEKLRIRRHPTPDLEPPENIGEILHILHAERIYLKCLSLDAFHHPGVFEYLTSYTGIERLCLKPRYLLDCTRELMDQFFFSVLPAHSTSLKELRLGMDWTTTWSALLKPEYQKSLKQCQVLEYLYCWLLVELEDVEANNTDVLVSWLETINAIPSLCVFKCPPVAISHRSFFICSGSERDPDIRIRKFVKKVVEDFQSYCRIDCEWTFRSNYYLKRCFFIQ